MKIKLPKSGHTLISGNKLTDSYWWATFQGTKLLGVGGIGKDDDGIHADFMGCYARRRGTLKECVAHLDRWVCELKEALSNA